MSNIESSMNELMSIDGFMAASIVDCSSGMMLGEIGNGVINLEVAAAGNTEVVRSKRKVMEKLNLKDDIEDILITLGKQYHLIRPVTQEGLDLFIYLVLDREKSNLALARVKLSQIERKVEI
ncbi:MAG: hypothetical protein R3F46_05680 [bacterium]